ncbi:MAG: DinB family protein [Candidatus Limnocylindrales bacterium]
MTLAPTGPAAPTAPDGEPRDRAAGEIDLRRAPLATIRALDLRADDRDFPADERAMWSRFTATWAGLDDAAWRYPGAAPSDAGGPDWSFLDHVAHVAAWQELALDYIALALDGAPWPTDADFEGGDFDRYNERLRDPWAATEPAAIRLRIAGSHDRLVELVGRLPIETIRSDAAWEWVYLVLHGHQLDHLTVLEPWANTLRSRQAEGDPFPIAGVDTLADPAAPIASFWAAEASIGRLFDETVRPVPAGAWEIVGPTEGWTLKDHVGHLAAWFDEAAEALDDHRRVGGWRLGPPEGVDAWNAHAVARDRRFTPAETLARYDAGRAKLSTAIRALSPDDLRDPEGWSWAYEDLHGHVRAHLAMIGPWCARIGWPSEGGRS